MLAASLRRLVLLASAGLVGLSCSDAPAAPTAEPVRTAVRVEVVATRPLSRPLLVPGVVEARTRISLGFRVAGFIDRFEVDEGDRVEAGQVLAALDPADFERDLRTARAAQARARAQAQDARRTFERQEQLRERGTSSQQAYDRAESAHRVAESAAAEARLARERAEDRLRKTTLHAPLAGAIERRLAEPHEVASAETPVLVLTQVDPATVRAAAADSLLPRLAIGGAARVRSPLRPDAWLEGHIARIGVSADALSHTVPFEVELPNPDGALLPELVVEVAVETEAPREALLVPMTAVLRDADTRPFCFLAVEDGEGLAARRRPVAVGDVHGDRIAVEEGLAVGDRIIVRGQHFLRDADPIRTVLD